MNFETDSRKYALCAVLGGLLLAGAYRSQAATVTAASVKEVDVSNAIASAHSGDTVIIPPGITYWTTTIQVTNGITIQGAGTNSTFVVDEIPRTGAYAAFVNAVLTTNQSFRMTGICFQGGVTNTNMGLNGFIRIGGTCPSVRIDHCYFDAPYQADHIKIYGQLYGVIDHCYFTLRQHAQGCLIWHDGWGGGNNAYGDGSWADASYFGSGKFMFIENCTFDNSLNALQNGAIDCYGGGRMVVRYSDFINCSPVTHGTESSHRVRGYRVAEIYCNNASLNYSADGGQLRGGTAVVFSNTYTGLFTGTLVMTTYREFEFFPPWGAAFGTNVWDVNDPHGLYYSGTHTGTNGAQVLVDTNANWKPNQWAGYELIDSNLAAMPNPTQQPGSYIVTNTSNTMTVYIDTSFESQITFTNGDTYLIYRVTTALDQCGRGQGALLSGGDGVSTPPTPTAWPNEALDPIYCWSNICCGKLCNLTTPYPTIQEGRDYYINTVRPGYTPYVYPHPLVLATTPPSAPSNLRIIPGSN